MYDVIIIGAGPAGLTAGYELSKNSKNILILEKQDEVGGLAQTKVFGNYRYDIGPHRFFTKNEEVYNEVYKSKCYYEFIQNQPKCVSFVCLFTIYM